MAKNKITDLRDHLFEAIELLKDEESNFSVDKAKAIADLSQVIINSAKLEVDFIRASDKVTGLVSQPEFLTPKQLK